MLGLLCGVLLVKVVIRTGNEEQAVEAMKFNILRPA
jgi:hypothetical protein